MAGMDMRMDQALAPQQTSVISHRQIIAVRLLQMPSQELVAAIARERDTNPAFESDERESCPHCGVRLETPGRPCAICTTRAADRGVSDFEQYSGGSVSGLGGQEDDTLDPLLRVAAGTGRASGLLAALRMSLPEDDAEIAEYLIGSLDHHGFLPLTIVEDAAEAMNCAAKRVAQALAALQRLDPPGIGARGARECLLIQLRNLRENGEPHLLAEQLVQDHLAALAFRHFREVAREVGESPRAVEAEWQFIREELHPYPTHGFDPEVAEVAEVAGQVRPDVVIRQRGDTFEAEVVERQRYDLRVNREYAFARKHVAEMGLNESDRQHVKGYVDQAQSFIAALKQRWDTMQRVSDALIEMQRDFLLHGQSALKPLTRADVAKVVELHESTVSRATDGKFALLPNGRVIPFDDFFDSSLPVKKELRELIAAENPRRPCSDEQLARILEKRGFVIARRTIAKYREEEGILPSRLRRNRGAAQETGTTPRQQPRLPVAVEAPTRALAGVVAR